MAFNVLVLALSLAPPVAQAQSPSLFSDQRFFPPQEVQDQSVKDLMRTGIAEYAKGRYEAARVTFSQAWDQQHRPQIAAALADVEMKLGRYGDAAEHWDYYLNHEPRDREEVLAQLDECKKHVSKVSITLHGQGDVLVDGAPVKTATSIGFWRSRSLWLSPGVHVFEARGSGEPTAKARVTLEVVLGKDHEVDLDPWPTAAIPTTQPASAPVQPGLPPRAAVRSATTQSTGSSKSNAWLVVTLAGATLTAGAIAFGAIAGLRSNAAWDRRGAILADLERERPPEVAPNGVCAPSRQDYPAAQCAEISSEIDNSRSLAKTANVAFITGGVLGAATLATFLLWPEPREATKQARIILAPLPVAGSHGVELGAAF